MKLARICEYLKIKKGFTIVDLLVIICVIGILAAIMIPVFMGHHQNRLAKQIKFSK